MAIKLKILLSRNRKTLLDFCDKNRIYNYEQLKEYCLPRELEPHTESEFNEIIALIAQKPAEPEVKKLELLGEEVDVKKKKTTKRKPRKTS